MARELLQPSTVKAAPPRETEYSLADGDGLYLRIRPSGHKSWVFLFSLHGKRQPKYTIGAYPDMGLADARREADKLRNLVALSIHPDEERKRQQREREAEEAAARLGRAPTTVQELFDRWMKDWCAPHHADKGTYVKGILERHAIPSLGALQLEQLRAPHIAEALKKVKDTGKLRTTTVVLSNLRQMCCYAVECGWLQGDPTAVMRKTTWGGPRVKRERVLSEDEIIELAVRLPDAELQPEISCAIWLMLSCMTRVQETGLVQREHVDLKAGTWLIPAANQKQLRGGNQDHLVHLSPFAKRWLKRLISLPQERENQRAFEEKRRPNRIEIDWLLPAERRAGPINEKTIAHAINDRQRFDKPRQRGRTPRIHALELPGGKWTPHDLRRTGATLMRELGVPADVVDRCQNHSETDEIRATYQRAELRREMVAAWDTLGARLDKLHQEAQLRFREQEDI